MKKYMKLVAIGVLVCVVVAICGCTSVNSPVQSSDNRAVDFANAYVSYMKAYSPSESITSTVTANGSDAAMLSMTITDHTHNSSSLYPNGTTSTLAFNVKVFPNTDAASTFYGQQSFGLTASNSTASNSTGPANLVDPYKQVTGNEPTLVRGASKLESLTLLGATISIANQTNEFVTYGIMNIGTIQQ
jgi:hypothetical protein